MGETEIDLTKLDWNFLLLQYTRLKQVADNGDILQTQSLKQTTGLSAAAGSTSTVTPIEKVTLETLKGKKIDDTNIRRTEACGQFCRKTQLDEIAAHLDIGLKETLEMLLDEFWIRGGSMPEGFSFVPLMKKFLVGKELFSVKQLLMDTDNSQLNVRELIKKTHFLPPSSLEIILTVLYAEIQESALYTEVVSDMEEIELIIDENRMDTEEVLKVFDEVEEALKHDMEVEHDAMFAELKTLECSMAENTTSFDEVTKRLTELSETVEKSKEERIAQQLRQIQDSEVVVMDDTEPVGEIVPTEFRKNTADLVVLKEVLSSDSLLHIRLPPLPPYHERPHLIAGNKCLVVLTETHLHTRLWMEGEVEEKKPVMDETRYKVRYFLSRNTTASVWVTERTLAYGEKPVWRLDEGIRVVAFYKDESNRNLDGWYSGTIGEKPASYNSQRYLVFFDDGAVQYVKNESIRLMYQQHPRARETYTDLPELSVIKPFMQKYLISYPDRMMIRVRRTGEKIRAERQGVWYMKKGEMATVVEIDGSLIKVRFPTHPPVDEWLFRGSPRIWEISDSTDTQKTTQRARASRNPTQRRRVEMVNQATVQLQVARKSTAQRRRTGRKFFDQDWSSESSEEDEVAVLSGEEEDNEEEDLVPTGRNYQVTTRRAWNFDYMEETLPAERKKPRSILGHPRGPCWSRCIIGCEEERAMLRARGLSPFIAPLLCGWDRQLAEFDDKFPKKKFVYYLAPCGRRLRTIVEVAKYLKMTESVLPGDYFTFERMVQPLRKYRVLDAVYKSDDYSNGNENIPVSVVNTFSDDPPPRISYSAIRYPWEAVAIPKICSGCRCEDDCSNPEKCSCQRLTIDGVENCLTPDDMPPKQKRTYQTERRLANHNGQGIKSGIYECNDMCSCRKLRCVNRVAQRPLMIPLQLFKTAEKGWGIRTLVDIPKGQFICIYAGAILSDKRAEELGTENEGGDEYFADLDLIAAVEREKEGYESEEEEEDDDDDVQIEEEDTERSRNTRDINERMESGEDDSLLFRINLDEDPMSLSDDGGHNTARKNTVSPPNSMMPSSAAPTQEESSTDQFSLRQYYGSDYLFVIDAKRCGNLGRYLNHSCEPNVFVQNVLVDTHDLRFPWVSFFALRTIKAGDELSWDYNYDVDENSIPIECKCGTKICRKRLR